MPAARRAFGGSLRRRGARPHGRNRVEHRQRVAGRRAAPRNGSQARIVRSGNAAASASTPTTVCASPSSRTVRPSTPGSAPKRWRHRRSDRTTTASRAGLVGLGEGRPDQQGHAEHRKQARRGGDDADAFGIAGAGQRRRPLRPRREAVDGARALPPRMEGGIAERAEPRRVAAARFLEHARDGRRSATAAASSAHRRSPRTAAWSRRSPSAIVRQTDTVWRPSRRSRRNEKRRS